MTGHASAESAGDRLLRGRCAGGGAASLYDPLDVTEFFEEEIRAAVRAAEDWGTYVMVHVYNPRGIARAIKAGSEASSTAT